MNTASSLITSALFGPSSHLARFCVNGRPSLARVHLPTSVPGGRVSDARVPSPASRSKGKPASPIFAAAASAGK